jgi:hypothetical protein
MYYSKGNIAYINVCIPLVFRQQFKQKSEKIVQIISQTQHNRMPLNIFCGPRSSGSDEQINSKTDHVVHLLASKQEQGLQH